MMSRRFHLIAYAGLMLGLAWPAASWAQTASKPLRLGVLPNISARILLTHYQPMREYLSEQLKREVVIETSTNFKTFAQSTNRPSPLREELGAGSGVKPVARSSRPAAPRRANLLKALEELAGRQGFEPRFHGPEPCVLAVGRPPRSEGPLE